MTKRIGLRHLRHFLAVAESKSMTRAAEALNTVQPALSRSLRELETELGAPLFHRTSQGMILTRSGEELLQFVGGPVAQIHEGLARVKGLPERASVRISVAPSISRLLGVRVLKAFSEQFPDIQVRVEGRIYNDSIKHIREGTIDFAVGRLLMPEDLGGLSFEHLFAEPIVFVARKDHPLANISDVTLAQINAFQIVAPTANAIIRREIDKYLIKHGMTDFDKLLETSSYEFARTYIQETDGIGCLSQSIILPELQSGAFVQLDIPVDELMGAVGMTYRAGGRLTPHARALFNLFRDHAKQVYP
ncbi:LysR substrate-binding domain-containing protein [Pararhodobacter sp.]|uniref:LysR substrate-binding domain-containing protein n=1 Tax=Pararhodobacter sp. TaxID=2127056 RepID=UPI002AFFE623|nr:LysR substrate-binding domain-containing protein [Pararhodobacter sp.]